MKAEKAKDLHDGRHVCHQIQVLKLLFFFFNGRFVLRVLYLMLETWLQSGTGANAHQHCALGVCPPTWMSIFPKQTDGVLSSAMNMMPWK